MQSFVEIGLSEDILKAIEELGFVTPTPIQERSIPEILNNGQDIISLAQTGTGKTGAFGLPIVQLADTTVSTTQALIICPTRELCLQITKDLTAYAKYKERLHIVPVYGGSDMRTQIKALKQGAHIVVGTPGRVNDMLRKDCLKIQNIRWLVLDEADEMLNMGFKDDIETILAETPAERQTLLFSATMPTFIANIASKYMRKPLEIKIGRTNQGADTVQHHYYVVRAQDRYLALKRIVDIIPDIYGIVFCRTRQETKDIADKLMSDGYNADALHGDLSQAQRDTVMQRFRMKHLQVLVATDVAARGIDVNELTHVINFDLPDDPEVYVHRSGRTGRAGKKGISISIIHSRELSRIRTIEKMSNKKFEQKMVPNADEICEKKLFHYIESIENQEVDATSPALKFMPAILEKLSALSAEELINKFVAKEFETFNAYYANAADLNVYPDDRRKNRSEGGQFARLFVNVGKIDQMRASDILSMVNDFTRDMSVKVGVGHIDIMRNFSFIEVDAQYADEVISKINGNTINGYKLIMELASPRPGDGRGESRGSRGGSEGGYKSRGYRGGDRKSSGGDGYRRGGDRDNRGGDRGGDRRRSRR